MGRKRNPLVEKSTILIIKIPNDKALEMLKLMGEDVDTPELVFDNETLKKLSNQMTLIIDNFIDKKRIVS